MQKCFSRKVKTEWNAFLLRSYTVNTVNDVATIVSYIGIAWFTFGAVFLVLVVFFVLYANRLSILFVFRGVFGAGKSFLLAVVVLLMVRLFEIADASDEARYVREKL